MKKGDIGGFADNEFGIGERKVFNEKVYWQKNETKVTKRCYRNGSVRTWNK